MTGSALLLLTLLSVACYFDLSNYRIPNWLTYSTATVALTSNGLAAAMANWANAGPPRWLGSIGWSESLLGMLIGFALMALVFAFTGSGAGDVKLAAAIGSIVGPVPVVSTILWSHLLAAGFVTLWFSWQVGPRRLAHFAGCHVAHRVCPNRVALPNGEFGRLLHRPIPLAGFFAIASILVLGGTVQ